MNYATTAYTPLLQKLQAPACFLETLDLKKSYVIQILTWNLKILKTVKNNLPIYIKSINAEIDHRSGYQFR